MTRQYIGARYVPIVFGEWVANHEYEPLTIVTYLSNSYTSKKSVPASVGNPADNPTYWVNTGNYNAQVEQYREDVINYKSDTDSAIEALSAKTLTGRHFLLIGDSLGMGISVNDGVVTTTKGWIGYTMDYIGHDKCTYVSINGGGFCEPSPYNWEEQLRSTVVATGDDSITDLVILGGTNDIDNTESEVITAMGSLVNYAKGRFKNLRRIACGAFCEPQFSSAVRLRYSHIKKLGGEYIGDMENLLCDASKYDGTKHTHLSEAGYAYYAPYACECVLSGHTSYKFEFTVNMTVANGIVVHNGSTILYIKVYNDCIEYYMNINPADNLDVTAPVNQGGTTPLLSYEATPSVYVRCGWTTPNTRGGSCMVMDADATSVIGIGNIVLGSYELFQGQNKVFINGNAVGSVQSARYYIGQACGGRIVTQ